MCLVICLLLRSISPRIAGDARHHVVDDAGKQPNVCAQGTGARARNTPAI